IVTVKIPTLMKVMSDIHAISLAAASSGALSNEQRIQLFVLKGSFQDNVGGITVERDKSFGGNGDGLLKKTLEASYKSALEKHNDFLSEVEQNMMGSQFHTLNKDDLNSHYHEALQGMGALWQGGNAELDRMLRKPIDGFEDSMNESMVITAILVVG